MAEQFPGDRSGGKDGTVVYLWTATLDPTESVEFAKRMTEYVRHEAAELPGFLEGRILQADDGTSVIIMTHWETRHAWADSRWNRDLGQVLADSFHAGVQIIDTMCYQQAVVSPNSDPT
jgi:hypothetical protein